LPTRHAGRQQRGRADISSQAAGGTAPASVAEAVLGRELMDAPKGASAGRTGDQIPLVCGLVALVLACIVLTPTLSFAGWNPSVLVHLGKGEASELLARESNPDFVFVSGFSHYDGVPQYLVARDPIGRGRAHQFIDWPAYRYEHPGYSWLAALLSLGQAPLLPGVMLLTNLILLVLSAYLVSLLAADLGHSPWWGLLVALSPGLMTALAFDTTEILLAATTVLGLLLWLRGHWTAGIVLIAACFAKELGWAVPLGLGLYEVARFVRSGAMDRFWQRQRRFRSLYASVQTAGLLRRLAVLAIGPALSSAWFAYVDLAIVQNGAPTRRDLFHALALAILRLLPVAGLWLLPIVIGMAAALLTGRKWPRLWLPPKTAAAIGVVAAALLGLVTWAVAQPRGGPITGYIVTPFIGTVAQSTRSFHSLDTTQTITGLADGQRYSFNVRAVNSQGAGPPSRQSTEVLVASLAPPGAPVIGPATPSGSRVSLSWTAPASDGGSPISGYVVTPYLEGDGGGPQSAQLLGSTETTATLKGLTVGRTYSFSVAASNGAGTGLPSAHSNQVTIAAELSQSPSTNPGVGVPVSPAIGLAAPSGEGQANVSWTAPPFNGGATITGYVVTPILAGDDGGPQGPRVFNSIDTTQTVAGLTGGRSYSFTVAAINASGSGPNSGYSNSVLIASQALPGAPTIGFATPGGSRATLSWTAPPSDGGSAITGYVVTPFLEGDGRGPQSPQTFNSSDTTQTVTGLIGGRSYSFRVAAINGTGIGRSSGYSNIVLVSSVSVPSAPAVGVATPGARNVTLVWSAPASDGGSAITGYVVTPYLDGNGGGPQPARILGSTETSASLEGLTAGQTYSFSVAARNSAGTGPASGFSNQVAITEAGVPGAPVIGPAAPAGAGKAHVTWSTPPGGGDAITGYVVTPYTGGVAQPARTLKPTATSQTLTGLKVGERYAFNVRATNLHGAGAPSSFSNEVAISAGPVPDAPAIGPVVGGNGQATITWVPPSSNNAIPATETAVAFWNVVGPLTRRIGFDYNLVPFSGLVGALAEQAGWTLRQETERVQLGMGMAPVAIALASVFLGGLLLSLRAQTPLRAILLIMAVPMLSLPPNSFLYPQNLLRSTAVPLIFMALALLTPVATATDAMDARDRERSTA